MSIVLDWQKAAAQSRRRLLLQTIRAWLTTWEIYPILLAASFLRLYQLNFTEFDEDQATVFRMARDAITHGLLPATSNIASIRINNPPGVLYLLMLPASISANPLGGAILVALLNILAVLLTYIFVRRYFGRLAAVLAATFYATASMPLHFSRFIWQQNMIAPFVLLFLFALFRGAVDRRKGWLFPAIFLLGLLIQLHETTALLAIPLVLAVVLAPETVRWRDLALGLLSLLLIYSTYLLWEIATHFSDASILLNAAKLPAHIDGVAISYYIDFFSPYAQVPSNPQTLVYHLFPLLWWLRFFMILLVGGGFVTVLLFFFSSFVSASISAQPVGDKAASIPAFNVRAWGWWTAFRSSPQRCGMLLLLAWQVVPLMILSRHSLPLFPYYLLLLMPGPFILIGLLVQHFSSWLRQLAHSPHNVRYGNILRYSLYAVTCIVLIAQVTSTTAGLIDETSGNNRHGSGYNSLVFMQLALNAADRLAQQRHLNHIYISSDQYSQVALRYLAEQMHTPTTVFDASRSLVLPGAADGPAVYLLGPGDSLALTLLQQFSNASLISQPARLGGAPYQLSIAGAAVPLPSSTGGVFVHHLQLLDTRAHYMYAGKTIMLATRWTILLNAPIIYRTTYTYSITETARYRGSIVSSVYSDCVFTSLRSGDQLIVTFPLHAALPASSQISFTARYYVTAPHNIVVGPLRLENIRDQRTPSIFLQTPDGARALSLNDP